MRHVTSRLYINKFLLPEGKEAEAWENFQKGIFFRKSGNTGRKNNFIPPPLNQSLSVSDISPKRTVFFSLCGICGEQIASGAHLGFFSFPFSFHLWYVLRMRKILRAFQKSLLFGKTQSNSEGSVRNGFKLKSLSQ